MGGTPSVKETQYEKELAKVYAEQWGYYKSNIVPIENKVIAKAHKANDSSTYNKISADSNIGYQKSFSSANKQTLKNLTASGVDPSSGKFKGAVSSLSDMEGSVSSDAKSRSQVAGQERYIDKMSNVVAMGQGQAQSSVASLNDIAVNSQRKAYNDASIASQDKANTLGAIGAIGGAFTNNSLHKSNTDSTGYDQNYGPQQ